jgi:hypothetical protein
MKSLWIVEEKMPWGWVPNHRKVSRTREAAREIEAKRYGMPALREPLVEGQSFPKKRGGLPLRRNNAE